MPATIIRALQAETGAAKRQDLRGFATTATPTSTDPIAEGHVACDTDGAALMGRTMHDTTDVVEATATAQTALPAYAKRARLMLQNLSDANLLWFDFGTPAVAGACFKCFPGQIVAIDGDACPADYLSVIADTGLTAELFAKDW